MTSRRTPYTIALDKRSHHSLYSANLPMPDMLDMPDMPFHTDISPSNTAPAIRAYLGGSFDPVHCSHVQMAMHVYQRLLPIAAQQQRALHVSLLPNARSPFKEHSTDPKHRLAMLTLATQNTPLQINELELWQTPPVYSIDSVRTLRQRYPNDSLIFIMGMDSARSLAQWKEGLQLIDYVHLWLFDRSNNHDAAQQALTPHKNDNTQPLSAQNIAGLRAELPASLQAHLTETPIDLISPLNGSASKGERLKSNAQGRIYIDTRQIPAVSSTDLRKQLRQQHHEHEQPQTDDSLTIKPNDLTKCLNPTVYQYIIAHQLYSAAQFR